MKKLVLVDGHSILNRAFYGLPDLTNQAGEHTGAVLGFLNIILRLLEEEQATNLVVAFDVHAPTFRHLQYEAYKGNRKPMPEELRQQVPLMKEVLQSMGVMIVEQAGFEADDIIGTLSRRASSEGYQVTVLSGDRDLLQLATDDILVRIPKTKMSGTTIENYYAKDVEERYGVGPIPFIDLKGLMGDASDNIPGVPGIGEKTAMEIIAEYGSIENAYAHIEEIKPNRAKENLKEYYEQAIMSKQLATIKLDCPLEVNLEASEIKQLFNEDSYVILKRLEFKNLLSKFDISVPEEAVSVDCDFVEDFIEVEELFATATNQEQIGFSFIFGQELLGVALCYQKDKVYFVPVGGFVTAEYLCEKVSCLVQQVKRGYTIQLKPMLSCLNDSVRTAPGLQDLELAAYLCNSLKSSYTYDDIARDYLQLTLPAKEELLGKGFDLNLITMQEDHARQMISYTALVPFLAGKKLEEALIKRSMDHLFRDIEMPTLFTLYDMEQRGIKVNKQELQEYGVHLISGIEELEGKIYEQAGEVFNINSPKQLGEILFSKLQLPGGKKTKTGYSTNAEILDKLKADYPIVNDILEYRTLTKLKSTYADGLANFIEEDQRIHSKFNQTITATGRLSSTEPNLQNIPIKTQLGREIRKVFIPKEGYVFVDADYSQIELRVLAHMADDETMIQAFRENADIHAITASQVFGVPLDEVTPLQRRNAKAVNFGIVYGISAFGLSQDLNISKKEASEYIQQYFATYGNVKVFLDKLVNDAKEKGYVTTMFQRIRPIPELKSSNFMQRSFGERVAMNSPIQGTAADIIKIAMVGVNQRLMEANMKSQLLLQIHDELLIEAHVDEVEQVKQILTEEMMNAAELKVPLEIDIHTGANWYEAK
jgi:DNA polymerase-1